MSLQTYSVERIKKLEFFFGLTVTYNVYTYCLAKQLMAMLEASTGGDNYRQKLLRMFDNYPRQI